MKKFTKGVKGSISLFLSMIILLLVILEGFLIDGSKVLAGKMKLANAGDLALNAGLTYYDEALRDIYGLFAISESEDELKANLEVHIRRTLGENVGAVDEGYVDSMLNFVDEAIQGEFSGIPQGNLLDMTMEEGSLDLLKLDASTLSHEYVLKQQILEYMKYRGPATLGYGILEKLNMFKDVGAQQDVMEKKLDYEEKLSEIDELCKAIYNALNPQGETGYNDLLDNSLKPENVEAGSLTVNQHIYRAIQGAWCYSLLKRDYGLNPNWKSRTDYSGTDVQECIDACTELGDLTVIDESARANLAGSNMEIQIRGGVTAVEAALGYVTEFEKYCTLYTAMENYEEEYERKCDEIEARLEQLDEEEDADEIDALSEELMELQEEYVATYAAYSEAASLIDSLARVLDVARNTMENAVNLEISAAKATMTIYKSAAESLQKRAQDGKARIQDLKNKLVEVKAAGDAWNTKIDGLSDGDVKTSMKADYVSESKTIDEEKIDRLRKKQKKGEQYAAQLLDSINNTKAINFSVISGSDAAESMRSNFDSSSHGSETSGAGGSGYYNFDRELYIEGALNTTALSDGSITVYWVETPGGGKMSGDYHQMDLSAIKADMDNISAKNDEFYKYIERMCDEKNTDEGLQSDAEGAKDSLLNAGNTEFKAEGIDVRLDGEDGGEKPDDFADTGSGAEDDAVVDNATSNTNSSVSFLDGIEALLTGSRNKLYLSQYAMEMFSYYTIEDTEEGACTLSNYPFSAANNVMYRAEGEYILWGNPEGQTNVNYTIMSIFGVRFLLNTLYAFTGDPEIRHVSLAMATAIAGWTGFGIPIVQSVIIIGFALAETANDMRLLLKGESVAIYKSTDTWVIKPSGVTKEAVDSAINTAATTVVNEGKNLLFNKLNELTEATKDDFKKTVSNYANDAVDTIVDTAVSNVLNPMEEAMVSLVNAVTPDRTEIENKISETLSAVQSSLVTSEDTIAAEITSLAFETFSNSYKSQLVDKIYSLQQRAESESGITASDLQNEIHTYFTSTQAALENSLRATAQSEVNKLTETVNEKLDDGNEKLQEKASDAIDEMMAKINGGQSDHNEASQIMPDGSKGKTSGAGLLTLNYKEYLTIFIAIESVFNEEKIIKRMGRLIEANLASSETKPSPDFKLSEAATMLELSASAEIKTTFFAMPVPMSGGGSKVLGQDSYSLSYKGVLGY